MASAWTCCPAQQSTKGCCRSPTALAACSGRDAPAPLNSRGSNRRSPAAGPWGTVFCRSHKEGPSSGRAEPSGFLKRLSPTYLSNRLFYGGFSLLLESPDPLLRDEFSAPVRWDTRGLPQGEPVECPHMPGLWYIRAFLGRTQRESVQALVQHLTTGGPAAGEEAALDRFEYERSRFMMPLQPFPEIDRDFATDNLSDLSVFNYTDPLTWPNLADLAADADTKAGAQAVIDLQTGVQQAVDDVRPHDCLFVQIQELEPGATVTLHKDVLRHGGEAIATAVITACNDISVGSVRFPVDPGDVYVLARHARHGVGHEVHASTVHRLSLTLRYGRIDEEAERRRPVNLQADSSAW